MTMPRCTRSWRRRSSRPRTARWMTAAARCRLASHALAALWTMTIRRRSSRYRFRWSLALIHRWKHERDHLIKWCGRCLIDVSMNVLLYKKSNDKQTTHETNTKQISVHFSVPMNWKSLQVANLQQKSLQCTHLDREDWMHLFSGCF